MLTSLTECKGRCENMLEITKEITLEKQKRLQTVKQRFKTKLRKKKEVTVDLGRFQVTFFD